jgi:pimeloyl-ACP methyl ester carboxylesterase
MTEPPVQLLLDTKTVTLRDIVCRGECRHKSAEECAHATNLVFPYRGVYVRHVGRDDSVAEPNQVLFFNHAEGYRVSHPIGGDACLSLDAGGAVAQLFVIKYPQRVRTLLLTNCDVETDSPPPALLPVIDLARAGVYPDLWLEPWLQHKDVARSKTGLGGMCYSNPAHPTDAAIDQYLGPLVASAEHKALVNRYTLGLTPNPLEGIAPLLRKCNVPTRIVWGASDGIFSPANPDYLAGILPRMTGIRRIPDAKLFFPEEYPDVIADEARVLWRRAGRSG